MALRSAALHDIVATCQTQPVISEWNKAMFILTFCKALSKSVHDRSCSRMASRCIGSERNSSTTSNRLVRSP